MVCGADLRLRREMAVVVEIVINERGDISIEFLFRADKGFDTALL